MARNKDKAVKEAETPRSTGSPPEQAELNASETKSEGEKLSDTTEDAKVPEEKATDKGGVIEPIAFSITLKALHPQATYGRCGYRFAKDKAVEIARQDLTDTQIIALAEDPYLDVVPITEV